MCACERINVRVYALAACGCFIYFAKTEFVATLGRHWLRSEQMISSCRCRVARRLVDAAGGLVLIMANEGDGWHAGWKQKGREVEDGTREEWGAEGRWERRRGEERGHGLDYWIYLFNSRNKILFII